MKDPFPSMDEGSMKEIKNDLPAQANTIHDINT